MMAESPRPLGAPLLGPALFALLLSPGAAGEELWGTLTPGEYVVGFSSEVALDHGRRYVTSFDGGATYGGEGKAPRPILVNLWYPAASGAARRPAMPHGAYFELEPDGVATRAWTAALAAYAMDVVADLTFGAPVADLDEGARAEWRRFLSTPTACRRDAPPADGAFPLVVYHSGAGSSYEDNAVLCEYLASHGYVVVGSAFPEADGSGFGVDAGDGSVRDIEFLIRFVSRRPFVDWSRIALAGHSAGAQASLRALCRPDAAADAVVLLDTTLDYYGLSVPTFEPIVSHVLEQVAELDRPMLVAAGPEASFVLLDRLSAAPRTYLTIPELGHDEYTAQGVLRLRLLGWLDSAHPDPARTDDLSRAEAVQAHYVALAQAVRSFLDAELRGERAPFEALCAGLATHALGGADLVVEQAAIGATEPPAYDRRAGRPPTPRQLRPLLDEVGVDALGDLLREGYEVNPTSPIYSSNMLVGSWLHDLVTAGRLEEARAVRRIFSEYDVDGLGTLRFLARMSGLLGRPERAREILEVAAAIDPDDELTRARLAELGVSEEDDESGGDR